MTDRRQIGALAGALVAEFLPQWPAPEPPKPQTADSRDHALAAAQAKRARRQKRNRRAGETKHKPAAIRARGDAP